MQTKYTIIDYTGTPVKFKVDDIDGYELTSVSQTNCSQFSTKEIAQAELNNINRILKNSDYYNVYVSQTVDLPLRVAGVKSTITIFEL